MRLALADMLEALALGQGLLVAPELGESHAGRTAQTIAALLLMLAEEARAMPGRRAQARQAMATLLAEAETRHPSLGPLLPPPGTCDEARHEALLHALERVHAFADEADAPLAARCRAVLHAWAQGERLAPPAPPGG
jgi:hypothetical protein